VDNQPLFGKPIEDILPEDPARARRSASPPPFESASRDRSADDLLAIARYQRWMMVCVLVHVLAVLMFPLAAIMEMEGNQPDEKNKGVVLLIFGLVMILVGVFALVLQVIFLLLALKLYSPVTAVLLFVGMGLLCVGVIIILVVNHRATSVLRSNGIRVGLLGARRKDLERLDPARHFRESGRMPKLGW